MMDGEIISTWDQQAAARFAAQLAMLVKEYPELGSDLSVLIEWLDKISWLGAER